MLVLPHNTHREPVFDPGETVFVLGPDEHPGWADVHQESESLSPRIAQALVGERVVVQGTDKDWCRISPESSTSWRGWLKANDLTRGTAEFRRLIQEKSTQVVIMRTPGLRAGRHTLLPFGATLPIRVLRGKIERTILLPDGTSVEIGAGDARVAGKIHLSTVLDRAMGLRHIPYQSGGNTVEGMDGPGLISLLFSMAGAQVPRNVQGIRKAGHEVTTDAEPGDVVIFENYAGSEPRAVVLLDEGTTFLEAFAGSGVDIGFVEQLRNLPILARRRIVETRAGSGVPATGLTSLENRSH